MSDVLCLGLLVADVIGSPIEKLPKPGTLLPIPGISLHVGGCAANTGSALARIGVKTSVLGATGDDGFGAYVRQQLQSRGTDIAGVVSLPAATSASIIPVNRKGERAFIHDVGANARLEARHLDWRRIARHKHLHVGGSFLMPRLDGQPLARVLKRARSLGLSTSLDTVYNPRLNWRRVLKPCLPHLDYFLPSYAEARQISGRKDPKGMAALFQSLGAGALVIKMGEEGCYVHDGKAGEQVPAPRIRPVDTTGAGDAFCAGFIAGRLRGWSLGRAARLGNVLGASCCLGVGAYDGLPDKKRAMALLKRWYRDHAA